MGLRTFFGPSIEMLQMQSMYTCALWVLRRRDQQTEYYTSWDEDLFVPLIGEGERNFKSAAHLSMSSMSREIGLRSQTTEARGVINDIDQAQLRAGAYDMAKLTEYVVDARFPFLPGTKIHKNVYWVSAVEISAEVWSFQMEGVGRRLKESVGVPHTRNCRWSLGQGGCATSLNRTNGGINIANFTWGTTTGCSVLAVDADSPRTVFDVSAGTGTPNLPGGTAKISHGKVTFLTGSNAGHTREVMRAEWNLVNSTYKVKVFQAFPNDIVTTDTVIVQAGCSGTWEACEFYQNEENFGGQQQIPGPQKARQPAKINF